MKKYQTKLKQTYNQFIENKINNIQQFNNTFWDAIIKINNRNNNKTHITQLIIKNKKPNKTITHQKVY